MVQTNITLDKLKSEEDFYSRLSKQGGKPESNLSLTPLKKMGVEFLRAEMGRS